jgi:hypothetical protein
MYGLESNLDVGPIDRTYLGELYRIAKCESRNTLKPWI